MPKLTDAQIAGYATGAGLSGGSVGIAVAIAIAESGGNTDAHNAVPPDDSYGLWQINMLGSLGPSRRQQWGLSQNSDLFNPAINARAMAALSGNGSKWSDWTTYTRGTYRMFLARGNAAAGNPADVGGLEGALTGGLTPVGLSIPDPFPKLTALFESLSDPDFWRRTGVGALGVGIGLLGVYFMLEKQGFNVVRKVEGVL